MNCQISEKSFIWIIQIKKNIDEYLARKHFTPHTNVIFMARVVNSIYLQLRRRMEKYFLYKWKLKK